MKKALLLVSILLVSVVSTACINNFAVQELNSKSKIYLDVGNYQEVIERLKSSIDLDDSIFETHYNLAVAYTQAEDYANAIEAYEDAINLDDSVADSYYSLAVAQGNLAVDLQSGSLRLDENGKVVSPENLEEDYLPSDDVLEKIKDLRENALDNFKTYLEKAPDASDAAQVQEEINKLETLLEDND
ncbi:tetratricopeptide repeat protein [bacterium]|nr:tetratricopeptide repeat protein [bacterium]